jgi:hypothetical protein
MLASNPLFLSQVQRSRNEFNRMLIAAKVDGFVYPSKHFFERVVERNLEPVDILFMAAPMITDFRQTTYNVRSYRVQWKTYSLIACISVGVETGKRRLVLKTVFERNDDSEYDVSIRL